MSDLAFSPETRMLVDGELIDADSGKTFDNVNPATEEVLGRVADASAAEMQRAIAAARRAFDESDDSGYGLSGSVASGDHARAMALARRIRTGSMSVNGGVWYGADMPYGGYETSGIGRQNGIEGFEQHVETKIVAWPAGA